MPRHLAYQFYHSFWRGLDYLFPPICGGCGRHGARWCDACQGSTRVIKPPFCQFCGEPQSQGDLCQRCRRKSPRFTALRSWAEFEGPVRHALHRLKYYGTLGIGEAFSQSLAAVIDQQSWNVDLVIPVPLSLARLAERGYNQSALLAKPLALALAVPYRPNALKKIRHTPSQVGLTAAQRMDNVCGAFQASTELISRKAVLVVDDVTTSGATLNECAGVLKEAGAAQVFGLTLARAVYKHELPTSDAI